MPKLHLAPFLFSSGFRAFMFRCRFAVHQGCAFCGTSPTHPPLLPDDSDCTQVLLLRLLETALHLPWSHGDQEPSTRQGEFTHNDVKARSLLSWWKLYTCSGTGCRLVQAYCTALGILLSREIGRSDKNKSMGMWTRAMTDCEQEGSAQ